MAWNGLFGSTVTTISHPGWDFSLNAKAELLMGYRIWSGSVGDVFGDRWVWFAGPLKGYGEVQIVEQWPESVRGVGRERDRTWHWVHWRNRGSAAIVQPRVLIAPELPVGWASQAASETRRRALWVIVERAQTLALGAFLEADRPSGSGGAGGGGGKLTGSELLTSVAIRPLKGQVLRERPLEGDLRYLPVEELWHRVDHLVARRKRLRKTAKR